jgi:peptide/nickel transport system substrate-binding protein
MIGINDVNARTNALKTGQVHAINRCERKTVHLLEKMPGIKIIRSDGTKRRHQALYGADDYYH